MWHVICVGKGTGFPRKIPSWRKISPSGNDRYKLVPSHSNSADTQVVPRSFHSILFYCIVLYCILYVFICQGISPLPLILY